MEQGRGLAETFLAHSKVHFNPTADVAALDSLLAQAWEASRAQWPTVALPAEPFVRHLSERLPAVRPDSSIGPHLEQLSLAELYLACACSRGMPSAIEAFDRQYLAKLPGKLRGSHQPDAMIDDVCQLTRVKLLVPTPESPPKIAEYTGRGALQSWVFVTAGRIAHKLRLAEKPGAEQDADTLLKMLPGPGIDPELDAIKRRYHADFRQAMREASAALSADERHLLRLYFVDQLSSYELASLFRVNQSTVSRWLKSARQTVYEETRSRLQKRLGLSTHDFKSFLAVLDSQLNLSISQLLGEKDSVPLPKRD